MSTTFKIRSNLSLQPRDNISVRIEGGDFVVQLYDRCSDTTTDISLLALVRRVDELEKGMAEMILLGEKKDG